MHLVARRSFKIPLGDIVPKCAPQVGIGSHCQFQRLYMLGIARQEALERLQPGERLFQRDARGAKPIVEFVSPGLIPRRYPLRLIERGQRWRELVGPVQADPEEQVRRPKRRIEACGFAKRLDGGLEAQSLPGLGGRPDLQLVLVSFLRGWEIPRKFGLARGR